MICFIYAFDRKYGVPINNFTGAEVQATLSQRECRFVYPSVWHRLDNKRLKLLVLKPL